MKKTSVTRVLAFTILLAFTSTAIVTSAFGQEKFSVSGEIAYWQKEQQEGQIMLWIVKKEERKKYYEVPQVRKLKIELSPQEGQESKLKSETVTFKFVNLPKGTYGIICILDKNKNGKLDYPEGATPGKVLPIEPYAHSGPRSGLGGPPQWENYAFNVEKDVSGIKIQLPLK